MKESIKDKRVCHLDRCVRKGKRYMGIQYFRIFPKLVDPPPPRGLNCRKYGAPRYESEQDQRHTSRFYRPCRPLHRRPNPKCGRTLRGLALLLSNVTFVYGSFIKALAVTHLQQRFGTNWRRRTATSTERPAALSLAARYVTKETQKACGAAANRTS